MPEVSTVDVRDYVIDSLRRELIGPDPGPPAVQWVGPASPLNGEEILRPQDRPRTRYGAGILFPNGLTYSGLVDTADDGIEGGAGRGRGRAAWRGGPRATTTTRMMRRTASPPS